MAIYILQVFTHKKLTIIRFSMNWLTGPTQSVSCNFLDMDVILNIPCNFKTKRDGDI